MQGDKERLVSQVLGRCEGEQSQGMKRNNKNIKNVPFLEFNHFLSPPSGNFHHRVHVFWEPEAVSEEDKEES